MSCKYCSTHKAALIELSQFEKNNLKGLLSQIKNTLAQMKEASANLEQNTEPFVAVFNGLTNTLNDLRTLFRRENCITVIQNAVNHGNNSLTERLHKFLTCYENIRQSLNSLEIAYNTQCYFDDNFWAVTANENDLTIIRNNVKNMIIIFGDVKRGGLAFTLSLIFIDNSPQQFTERSVGLNNPPRERGQ